MASADTERTSSNELTRRRLVQVGAAGAATFWLGSRGGIEGIARAAGATNGLHRSDYMALSSPGFTAAVDGSSRSLELIGVEDLGIAGEVPSLRGSDDAFALRFRGDGANAFTQGTRELRHPQLGAVSLFIVPIEQRTSTQDYGVTVDRTVRIPGLEEDGSPQPVDPGKRADTSSPHLLAQRPVPRLSRAALRRSTSGRRLLAEVTLANAAGVTTVRANLLRRGRVVASASAGSSRGRSLLRFPIRAPRNAARYELSLVAIDDEGQVTSLRKPLRLG
jgi:hypothetical protein